MKFLVMILAALFAAPMFAQSTGPDYSDVTTAVTSGITAGEAMLNFSILATCVGLVVWLVKKGTGRR